MADYGGGLAYGSVDLYAIKASLNCGLSRMNIVLDSILYVLLGHLFWDDRGTPTAIPGEMGCTTL